MPNEVCGFVVHSDEGLELLPSSNHYPDPEEGFMCSGSTTLEAKRRGVAYVYHSHPTGPALASAQDRAHAIVSEMPYVVYGVRDDAFETHHPDPHWKTLLGVPYDHRAGRDCWWLIERVLDRDMGISLPTIGLQERLSLVRGIEDPITPRVGVFGLHPNAEDASYAFGDVIQLRLSYEPGGEYHTAIFVGENRILHFWRGGMVTVALLDDMHRSQVIARYRHEEAPCFTPAPS